VYAYCHLAATFQNTNGKTGRRINRVVWPTRKADGRRQNKDFFLERLLSELSCKILNKKPGSSAIGLSRVCSVIAYVSMYDKIDNMGGVLSVKNANVHNSYLIYPVYTIHQMSRQTKNYVATSTCILNTFAGHLLDRVNGALRSVASWQRQGGLNFSLSYRTVQFSFCRKIFFEDTNCGAENVTFCVNAGTKLEFWSPMIYPVWNS